MSHPLGTELIYPNQSEAYMKEVLPNPEETESFKKELLEIAVDVTEFLADAV